VLKAIITYSDKRILVCPLDWGLGHASRCVPLIKQLQLQNNKVIIACTDWQKKFLQNEITGVEFTELFGYNVKYSEKLSLGLKILLQFPRLSSLVRKEHYWLEEFLKNNQVDVVISDNRFGLYNKKAECVFMTHQLFVPAPFLPGLVNKMNFYFIKKFDACWVPDFEEKEKSLSGKLSHGGQKLKNIKFIGPLSRFEKKNPAIENKFDVLILLSGIEPQRALLEEKLTKVFSGTNYRVVLVRGSEIKTGKQFSGNFLVYERVNTKELEELLLSSQKIVCRSGYSTLMDLHAMGLKALLIPTPGQTEQEYLAEYWNKKFGFKFIAQNKISKEAVISLLDLKESSALQKQSL
jgi:UDP:flavonoid glycosyltransferase YjiC (YdhE family)